jgi:hypothetical protein
MRINLILKIALFIPRLPGGSPSLILCWIYKDGTPHNANISLDRSNFSQNEA